MILTNRSSYSGFFTISSVSGFLYTEFNSSLGYIDSVYLRKFRVGIPLESFNDSLISVLTI